MPEQLSSTEGSLLLDCYNQHLFKLTPNKASKAFARQNVEVRRAMVDEVDAKLEVRSKLSRLKK